MMKKDHFIELLLLTTLLVLSGCTQLQERAEQLMWEHSGVTEDFSYLQYQQKLRAQWDHEKNAIVRVQAIKKEIDEANQQMDAANALDENGLYHSAELESYEKRQEKPGTVHVSFARNDFLHFDYYRDEALSQALETSDCWMNPGEAVFAGEPELTNPNSNLYRFSEFVVLELNEKGSIKGVLQRVKTYPGEVYRIPEDFTGTDISIIPIGEYLDRTVKLSAVTVASDGSRTSLENGMGM